MTLLGENDCNEGSTEAADADLVCVYESGVRDRYPTGLLAGELERESGILGGV